MSGDSTGPEDGENPAAEVDPPGRADADAEPAENAGTAGEDDETAGEDDETAGEDDVTAGDVHGDPEFSDLHPVTALLNAVQWGANTGVLLFFLGVAGQATGLFPSAGGFALGPVGFLLGAGYGVANYMVFEYRLGGSALYITSGVFQRQNREIPLRRIQNVDVHQSFVARLLGLAAVRLETAGGGQTEAELRLVSREEANRLQREVRRRKRSADLPDRGTVEGSTADRTGAPEDAETVLFELSMGDLLVLSGVSFRSSVLFLLVFGVPLIGDALTALAVDAVGDGSTDPLVAAVAVASFVGLLLAAWLVSAALTFVRYFDFRLSRIDDELAYERGLLQRYSGSIPLDKVQTLTIRDNPLMRRLGYAALLVETAGYTPGQNREGGGVPSAVPLAAREDVEAFATDLEGVESFEVQRPPTRARNRYAIRYGLVLGALTAVLFALDRFVVGLPWYVVPFALVLAPVAGHLKWSHRGYALGEDHLVTRAGFWRRSTQVVPYYRIQTVVTEQTVFQRRWRIASVVADTASSSALLSSHPTAYDVDEDRARRLHDELRDRLRASLRERRATAAGPDDPPADDG